MIEEINVKGMINMRKTRHIIIALCIGLLLGFSTVSFAQSDYVQAVFSKFNFEINGEKIKLNSDPLVHEGRTYLPVRDLLETLGYEVDYIDETRTIAADLRREDFKMNDSAINIDTEGSSFETMDSVVQNSSNELEVLERELSEVEFKIQSTNNAIKTHEKLIESYEDQRIIDDAEQEIEQLRNQILPDLERQKTELEAEIAKLK